MSLWKKTKKEISKTGETISKTTEKMIVPMARDLVRTESFGGLLLVLASILALIVANSALAPYYSHFLDKVYFSIGFSEAGKGFTNEIKKSVLHWINDGLMALFFFLVGMEIKREFLADDFTKSKAVLPFMAAIGGMVVPALLFWALNKGDPQGMSGWAIPTATDIAFSLAVLSLLGKNAPPALKVLLTMIAVVDDIGAILIIAFFYTGTIHITPLYVAAGAIAVLFILNRRNVHMVAPYAITGLVLWAAVLESGIHATLAGVITALFLPLRCKSGEGYSPLKHLEHDLYPLVMWVVVPLFAFANMGIPLAGMNADTFLNPVTLGITLGLFVGKQLGIFGMMALAIKTGLSPKPDGISWAQLYAIAALCGIGFTMSLFIGSLSYEDVSYQVSVRVGVLVGSLLSAAVGYFLLKKTIKAPKEREGRA